MLPEEVEDPYFDRWKELQKRHLVTINDAFDPVPILKARLHDQEVLGPDLLQALGGELYGERDPAGVLFSDDPLSIVKRGEDYVLTLKLSFARREDLDVSTKADELFVKVGPYRRTIMLPKVLAAREISSAKLVHDRLEVVFQKGTYATG